MRTLKIRLLEEVVKILDFLMKSENYNSRPKYIRKLIKETIN